MAAIRPAVRLTVSLAFSGRGQLRFNEVTKSMWLIVLEALGALCVFVFLIWWTMFSGRRGGELGDEAAPDTQAPQDGERGGSKKDSG